MEETRPPRRYVTGLDEDGRSCVVFREPENIYDEPLRALWTSDQAPASQEGNADRGGGPMLAVPGGGSLLMAYTFLPSDVVQAPGMHATNTLDYVVIVEGSVTLHTETEEIVLHAGDVVVDRGIVHGWRNHTDKPCRGVTVVIDAQPLGAGATIDEEGRPLAE